MLRKRLERWSEPTSPTKHTGTRLATNIRMPIRTQPIDPHAVEAGQRRMFAPAAERQASLVAAIICDLNRLKIVRALQATPMAASDLARVIGKTRSATSQHLRVLRELDVVTAERRGNVVRYRLSASAAARVLSDVSDAFDRLAA